MKGSSGERAPDPLVSVLIATRDRLGFLNESLGSVMAQTLRSFEAIVIDDASSDETAIWLAGLSDERVTAVVLEEHSGRAVALNRGLQRARGRFVLFLDDDDRLRPSALKTLHAALARNQDAIGAVGARVLFDEQGQRRKLPHPRRTLKKAVWTDLLAGWMSPPGTVLWKTDAINVVGRWNETIMVGGTGGDRELWLRASSQGPMILVPDVVLEKRTHGGQRKAIDARQVQERWLREYVGSLPPEERARAVRLSRVSRLMNDARIAYGNLKSREALSLYLTALRIAPSVLTSPLLRSTTARRIAKSLMGTLVGTRVVLLARRTKRALLRILGRDVQEVKQISSSADVSGG